MILETLSEHELTITLLAITLLLTGAFICGKLFEYFKAPKVVGEIVGGMVFGGSCLYFFFPNLIMNIFKAYPKEDKVLNIFYHLGLIFLMFSSGFNTKIDINKKNLKIIFFLFVGATIIPIIISLLFVNMFVGSFIGEANNKISFVLVFIISIAITSIPVISKIFFDMNIMNTNFANIVLTTSTFQDLCLWIMLNTATNIVSEKSFSIVNMILVTIFTIGLFIIANIISKYIHHLNLKINLLNYFPAIFILLFFIIFLLSILKINIMYSAFVVGYLVKNMSEISEGFSEKIKSITDFSFAFFIPVYFALVGIQLNVIHNFSLIRFCIYFIIAFSLEAIGCVAMLVFTNLNKKSIVNFAITMNARGGPGIVLATVAYSYKIINIEFFTVLILTTMLSSLIAGYWLRYQQRKDDSIFMQLTN